MKQPSAAHTNRGPAMSTSTRARCPIYVITLEHAHARRQAISARLQELGLAFEFVPGVDGRTLDLESHPDYAPTKRRFAYGRDLSAGELGCSLAHRNLYRLMVERRDPFALVLEDDATLTESLPAVLDALCACPGRWDLVRFLGRPKNYRAMRRVLPLWKGDGACWLARARGTPGGTYGYLLNQRAAARLLEASSPVWLASDALHGLTWHTRLRTLAVMPSPVLPNDAVPSHIDSTDNSLRWDQTCRLTGWRRAAYPFTRGLWKLYLNLGVLAVWLRHGPADALLRGRALAEIDAAARGGSLATPKRRLPRGSASL